MAGYGAQYGVREYGIEDDPPAFWVVLIEPAIYSDNGGEKLTLTGIWDPELDMEIHFGPLGSVADPMCYFGQGYGYSISSPDSNQVSCWTPPCPAGTAYLTITIGSETITIGLSATVVERVRQVKTSSLLASHPPWTYRKGILR